MSGGARGMRAEEARQFARDATGIATLIAPARVAQLPQTGGPPSARNGSGT